MASTSLAMVQLGPKQLEAREFPVPRVGRDDGLLRVERCGICGSDVEQLNGDLTWVPYPVIPGHEPLGVIEELGDDAARRWGVQVGDRVIVESAVPCRHCRYCAEGLFNACSNRMNIGYVPIGVEPTLFGGYAEYLYLHPNVTLHQISPKVPLDVAPFYNALACGVSWASQVGGTTLGDTVVVLGSGQRGIASGLVAKAVGAETVIMTGLTKDENKFAVARELGIDVTVDVEREDLRDTVSEITGGQFADVVIDVVPNVADTFVDAVEIVKHGGTIVMAAMKGDVAVKNLFTDRIALKAITVKGVLSKPSSAYSMAISILESMKFPFEKLQARTYALQDAVEAIDALAGRVPGENPISVSLNPGA